MTAKQDSNMKIFIKMENIFYFGVSFIVIQTGCKKPLRRLSKYAEPLLRQHGR